MIIKLIKQHDYYTLHRGVFLFVIKPFCGENLILIGWAWLPSGWAYALQGPPMAAPLPIHMKSID
jgi:hypothetical protein